jgi:hypothetical protein
MLWIGWVVAVLAIGVALGLHRALRAERAHGVQLLYAKIDAENQRSGLQAELTQLAELARQDALTGSERLRGLLDALRGDLESAGTDIAGYRERVRRFDAAVQYCLQPVELIFGADKASLDELVRHVEGARRSLFEARAEMDQHPIHRGTDPLGGVGADLLALQEAARGPQQAELPLAATAAA